MKHYNDFDSVLGLINRDNAARREDEEKRQAAEAKERELLDVLRRIEANLQRILSILDKG